MTIQKITDTDIYSSLVDRFLAKETLSNNYMLPDEVSELISKERLYVWHDESNCLFFIKKAGDVLRVYYLLNDLSDKLSIDLKMPLVTEILFRGSNGVPETELSFLKAIGFSLNLRRDQLSTTIPDITYKEPQYARSEADVIKAIELFNSTFDIYSGDYIDPLQAEDLYVNRSIICSYNYAGLLQGALEITILGRNAWVSHLVVAKECRGKGIAGQLMEMFISDAKGHDCKRLMLWVQHQNREAISLYKKYGFNYTNKSTISLIKE